MIRLGRAGGLGAIIFAGCLAAPPPPSRSGAPRSAESPAATAAAAEDAVLAKLARDYAGTAVAVCVRSADPAPERLDRLARETGAHLLPCRAKEASGAADRPRTVLSVTRTEQRAGGEFDVTAGYSCGNLCGASSLYRVRREAGRWVIVSEKTLRVS
jgi:hypothetical protein